METACAIEPSMDVAGETEDLVQARPVALDVLSGPEREHPDLRMLRGRKRPVRVLYAMIAEVREQQQIDAKVLVARVARELEQSGRRVTSVVCDGDPATEIVALANAREADLVVAGVRVHSAIRALLVGSVTGRLLKKTPCSVLVVH